uniref:Ion transport domain-containing protein n=1 Tax=Chromera velia CCMP2878 TaxID=1169474 RepID=A0A0K6SBA3_9ALVE|eukprot:Cvel_2169.t1-p1 / transcript=Cvel_2169.t1 / gene=Cvel_2169 / organism=Chromera_velia_CCMP2878 / gene_product=Ankyrin-2, putative / transcript_product=Ankyrin-2, putative / location=Cvel_scaffold84:33021-39706(-) / protein_length=1665 / sequence_SO=supercontig / SO=protein_coding / is_pseudo=false
MLLRSGASVSLRPSTDPEGRQRESLSPLLHIAAERGQLGMVELLVQNGAELNAVDGTAWRIRDGEGMRPLQLAVVGGHWGVAEELVERGAVFDVDSFLEPEGSLLHKAAQAGHAGLVRAVIARVPDVVTLRDSQGSLALHLCAERGHLAACRVLLAQGAEVSALDERVDPATGEAQMRTALFLAAGKAACAPDQVRLLLRLPPTSPRSAPTESEREEGATVSPRVVEIDVRGERDALSGLSLQWTALHVAAKMDCAEVVELLLGSVDGMVGAGVARGQSRLAFLRDSYGLTAFHVAARFSSPHALQVFLRSGLFSRETSVGGDKKWTALHFAAASATPSSDPSFRGRGHRLSREISVENDRAAMALLTAAESDPESESGSNPVSASVVDLDGLSPLHLAAREGNVAGLRFLIDERVLSVDVGGRGRRPRQGRTENGVLEGGEGERDGTESGSGDLKGVTPLMLALEEAQREAVEELLKRNASALARTPSGRLPVHFAAGFRAAAGGGEMSRGHSPSVLVASQLIRILLQSVDSPSKRLEAVGGFSSDRTGEKALHVAARTGSPLLLFRVLLEEEVRIRENDFGASRQEALRETVEAKDGLLRTLLLVAAAGGQLSIVRLLLSTQVGARLDAVGEEGKSALHLAAGGGHLDIVRELLFGVQQSGGQNGREGRDTSRSVGMVDEKGLGAQARDWSGGGALHVATALGREDIVDVLCEGGGNPNAERDDGAPPVLLAARRGSLPTLSVLQRRGARGLFAAVVDPSVALDSLCLLSSSADVRGGSGTDNRADGRLRVPSVCRDSEGVMRHRLWAEVSKVGMMKEGAGVQGSLRSLSARSGRGGGERRALSSSVVQFDSANVSPEGSVDAATASALSAVSASLPSRESRIDERMGKEGGLTALQMAASRGLSVSVSQLLDWGADVEGRTEEIDASLQTGAATSPSLSVALVAGASALASSLSPLLLSANNGHEAVALSLIERGADVSKSGSLSCVGRNGTGGAGETGRTALHYAAYLDMSSLVRRLLERGANINTRDGKGQTPLLLAARSLSVASLRELLRSDEVDLTVIDRDGHHALSLAAGAPGAGSGDTEGRKREVLQILKEEDKRKGGEWDDCEVFRSLCKEPLICEDPRKGLWSRETTAEQLCRPPTEWELLLRVVKQQVDRILLIIQVSILGVLLLAAVTIVWVIPKWKEEWREWEMRFPPLLGAILQINNIYTDLVLIVLVGAAAVNGEVEAVGLFTVSILHAVGVVAFNAFALRRFYKRMELSREPWWKEVRPKPLTGVMYMLGLISLKFATLATSNLFGVAPLSMRLRVRNTAVGGEGKEKGKGDGGGEGSPETASEVLETPRQDVEAGQALPESDRDQENRQTRDEKGGKDQDREDVLCGVTSARCWLQKNSGERKKEQQEKKCVKCEDRKQKERIERERQQMGFMSAEKVDHLVFSASTPAILLEEIPQLAVKVLFFVLIPDGQKILTLILGTALAALGFLLVLVRFLFTRQLGKDQRGKVVPSRHPIDHEVPLKKDVAPISEVASPLDVPEATAECLPSVTLPQDPSGGIGLFIPSRNVRTEAAATDQFQLGTESNRQLQIRGDSSRADENAEEALGKRREENEWRNSKGAEGDAVVAAVEEGHDKHREESELDSEGAKRSVCRSLSEVIAEEFRASS